MADIAETSESKRSEMAKEMFTISADLAHFLDLIQDLRDANASHLADLFEESADARFTFAVEFFPVTRASHIHSVKLYKELTIGQLNGGTFFLVKVECVPVPRYIFGDDLPPETISTMAWVSNDGESLAVGKMQDLHIRSAYILQTRPPSLIKRARSVLTSWADWWAELTQSQTTEEPPDWEVR